LDNPREVHSYRLVFTEGDADSALEVEFDENCADPAFNIARKACGTGDVHLFADGRLLAHIRRSPAGDWIVS